MSPKKPARPGRFVNTVLRSLFRRPATVNYPTEKLPMPEQFRGRLMVLADKCVGCKLCMRDCPADAIQIRKVGEKKYEAEIDMGKCTFCYQCVYSCLKQAIVGSGEFELASTERDKLKVVFHAEPALEGGT